MNYIIKKNIKLPKRKKKSHKGENGRALIVGGSEYYTGAIALAGVACLRAGCDWVTIVAPEKVAWVVNKLSADLITKKIKGNFFRLKHANEIIRLSNDFDSVLVGNGIGTKKETINFVKKIIKGIKRNKVVDADGIKAVNVNDLRNSIITPHMKELESFLKNSRKYYLIKKLKKKEDLQDRVALLKDDLKEFLAKNNVILLKGRVDVIISERKTFYNKTGNEGMTKAGTGDVLAGLVLGFLAQSNNLLQSAVNASFFNGLIGDILLRKKKGYSYLASDMVGEIKRVVK